MWQYLQDIRKKEEITIFLTTHYLDEAEGSDYICIIDSGKIIEQGSPQEIRGKLIKKYIVLDAANRDDLKNELFRQKLNIEGTGPFKIAINENTGQEEIKKIQSPLTYLDIHNPTLEDAYIEIISKNNVHD